MANDTSPLRHPLVANGVIRRSIKHILGKGFDIINCEDGKLRHRLSNDSRRNMLLLQVHPKQILNLPGDNPARIILASYTDSDAPALLLKCLTVDNREFRLLIINPFMQNLKDLNYLIGMTVVSLVPLATIVKSDDKHKNDTVITDRVNILDNSANMDARMHNLHEQAKMPIHKTSRTLHSMRDKHTIALAKNRVFVNSPVNVESINVHDIFDN